MSIREIIVRLAEDMDGCDKDDGRGCALHGDIARISAEVALMEAVCEAAADYLQDTCNECGFRTCEMPDSDIGCSLDDIRNTHAALDAYRKERGL